MMRAGGLKETIVIRHQIYRSPRDQMEIVPDEWALSLPSEPDIDLFYRTGILERK